MVQSTNLVQTIIMHQHGAEHAPNQCKIFVHQPGASHAPNQCKIIMHQHGARAHQNGAKNKKLVFL